MSHRVLIRDMTDTDVEPLTEGFGDWPKPRELFEGYVEAHREGHRDGIVAYAGDVLVGYVTVRWESSYPPFLAAGVPEIVDLNTRPEYRRRGIATALLDEAERRVAARTGVCGIGVGLYTDYGSAQRLYVRRGYLPDGCGVVLDGEPVTPGTMLRLDDDPVLMLTRPVR